MSALDNLPPALVTGQRFVLWKLMPRKGDKPAKVPFRIDGKQARVNDEGTWATFGEARRVLEASGDTYAGIGRILTGGPFACIDIDNGIDSNSEIWPFAREIIAMLPGAYVEISPGGRGLHVWVRGRLIRVLLKKFSFPGDRVVETYDGSAGRFITITGSIYAGRGELSADDMSSALNLAYMRVFQACQNNPATERAPVIANVEEARHVPVEVEGDSDDTPDDAPEIPDTELIRRVRSSRDKTVFNLLFDGGSAQWADWKRIDSENGNVDLSYSGARMVLYGILARWTGKRPAQIGRLFQRSAVCRENPEKCQRLMSSEITTAIRNCDCVYSGSKSRSADTNISGRRWREVRGSLSSDEKLVFIEMLCGDIREISDVAIMLFPHLCERLSVDTGLGLKRVRRALSLLRDKDFVFWTQDGSLIFSEKIRYHWRIQNQSYLFNVVKYLKDTLPKLSPRCIKKAESLFSEMQLSFRSAKSAHQEVPKRHFSFESAIGTILDVVRLYANGE